MKTTITLFVMSAALASSMAVHAAAGPSLPMVEPVPVSVAEGLTKAEKDQALTNLMREMEAQYVDADIAKTISAELKKWMVTDEYRDLSEPVAFSSKVNALLKKNVTDAHLRFMYSESVLPPRADPREPSPAENARRQRELRYRNAAFDKVERLPGNVGYIKFNMFASPEDMARPVEGAMRFLADTEAMIIDLRQNGGGSPSGVQLFCSYFFSETPVHLNSIYYRPTNETTEFWTLKELPGPRFTDKPVYVLVGNRTGSGAEECAYNFQTQKRGTIIGESTWGGANPGGTVRLGDHFSCFIPVGKAINPVTKTNWEGTGVIPDEKVAVSDALKVAHLKAIQVQIDKETDAEFKGVLQRAYDSVKAGS